MTAAAPRLNLIAHRGYPTKFPENTMAGYRAAMEAGAAWVETDVQLTRDGRAVLYHDIDLQRISDRPGRIVEQSAMDLRELRAAHRARFGDRFAEEPIATLEQLVRLLSEHPSVQAMVELKPESIKRFGADTMLQIVHDHLCGLTDRCVIISLDADIVMLARARHGGRIGWVLSTWNPAAHQQAERMRPEFLFASIDQLTIAGAIPRGPWNWAIYSINDPPTASDQLARGIAYVETDAIGEMLQHERLALLCRTTRDSIS